MASKAVDPIKLQKNIKKTNEDLEYQKKRLETQKQRLADEQAGENRDRMVELYSDWVRESEAKIASLEKKLAKYEKQLADAGFDSDSLARAAEDQKLEGMKAELEEEQQRLQKWIEEFEMYQALYRQTDERLDAMASDDPNRSDVKVLANTYYKKYNRAYDIKADLEKSIERRKKNIEKIETARAKKEAEARGERYDDGRNVQALRDFLDQWRDKCYAEMLEEMNCEARKNALAKVRAAYKKYRNYKYAKEWWPTEEEKAEKSRLHDIYSKKNENYMSIYGIYEQIESQAEAHKTSPEVELKKMLDDEWIRKYDDLLYRIEKHVGNLTDASHLYVGNNGSINGYVEGDTGKKARVETIIAAGPIRKAHYRVIIEPIKSI